MIRAVATALLLTVAMPAAITCTPRWRISLINERPLTDRLASDRLIRRPAPWHADPNVCSMAVAVPAIT